jgi:hypothetical protein
MTLPAPDTGSWSCRCGVRPVSPSSGALCAPTPAGWPGAAPPTPPGCPACRAGVDRSRSPRCTPGPRRRAPAAGGRSALPEGFSAAAGGWGSHRGNPGDESTGNESTGGSTADGAHGDGPGGRQAVDLGLPVRVALTETPQNSAEIPAVVALLAGLGVPAGNFAARPLLRRGLSATGQDIAAGTTIPELTVSTDGLRWHPAGADAATSPDMLLALPGTPLAAGKRMVTERFFAARLADVSLPRPYRCAVCYGPLEALGGTHAATRRCDDRAGRHAAHR